MCISSSKFPCGELVLTSSSSISKFSLALKISSKSVFVTLHNKLCSIFTTICNVNVFFLLASPCRSLLEIPQIMALVLLQGLNSSFMCMRPFVIDLNGFFKAVKFPFI
ncbi:hypothetical protein V8G54_003924 [Vigna mungo]|uniref:Uncharacterized protein n=1 Tax=Vigna mungo TaxID=3915 RepID=A0AAQ3PBB1_VIGMU